MKIRAKALPRPVDKADPSRKSIGVTVEPQN
jgi:hypothetical protein